MAMGQGQDLSSAAHFADLDDPRVERPTHHALRALLTSARGATICGADGWVEVEEVGQAKRGWFDTFLDVPRGSPSHDTCGRVFAVLDPDRFAACFRSWVAGVHAATGAPGTAAEVIALDGKEARRAHDRGPGGVAPGERVGHRGATGAGATGGRGQSKRAGRAARGARPARLGGLHRAQRREGRPRQHRPGHCGGGRRLGARAQRQPGTALRRRASSSGSPTSRTTTTGRWTAGTGGWRSARPGRSPTPRPSPTSTRTGPGLTCAPSAGCGPSAA